MDLSTTTIAHVALLAVSACLFLAASYYSIGLSVKLKRAQELLSSERQGRITSEKRLRNLLQGNASATDESSGKEVILRSNRFPPIGTISSPFKKRTGTPRQGGLVPTVRAKINMDVRRTAPQDSLTGIEQYSHLWILWEFNLNTNIGGNVKAKVVPPRANGQRVGLYATRTPHRHNNIGLSLVTLLGVSEDRKSLIVGGADLIDGTPILDIKPYTPAFEAIPFATVPDWVGTNIEAVFDFVQISVQAREQLDHLVLTHSLEFYGPGEQNIVADTLEELCRLQDFRSRHQKTNLKASKYSFDYDSLHVDIEITSIQPASQPSTSPPVQLPQNHVHQLAMYPHSHQPIHQQREQTPVFTPTLLVSSQNSNILQSSTSNKLKLEKPTIGSSMTKVLPVLQTGNSKDSGNIGTETCLDNLPPALAQNIVENKRGDRKKSLSRQRIVDVEAVVEAKPELKAGNLLMESPNKNRVETENDKTQSKHLHGKSKYEISTGEDLPEQTKLGDNAVNEPTSPVSPDSFASQNISHSRDQFALITITSITLNEYGLARGWESKKNNSKYNA